MTAAAIPQPLPPKRSLALWALFALSVVVLSYLITLLLAVLCVALPWLLMWRLQAVGFTFAMIFFGGLCTAISLIWSMVPRKQDFNPPAVVLTPAEQPELFAELQRLATSLKQPLPSEVLLTAAVNAGVLERRGSMGSGRRRTMHIGLYLMSVLSRAELRAVLAHEFAHYYGGDTRLGPWVYHARAAMARSLQMTSSEKSLIGALSRQPYAIAVQAPVLAALRAYWRFFLRATQLVSRRQELRADELAAHIAGSDTLVKALFKIHRATVMVAGFNQTEILPAMLAGYCPPLGEGLARFLTAPAIAKAATLNLEAELKKTATSPYDSHPALRRRVTRLQTLAREVLHADDALPATGFLTDMPGLERALLHKLNPKLHPDALVRQSWDNACVDVHVPQWKTFIAEHSQLIGGITLESLPQALGRLREIGSHIRDPQGFLLSPEQRQERAASLMWTALTMALAGQDWDLHVQPGHNYVERDGERISSPEIVMGLRAGTITDDVWKKRCRDLGIADVHLDGSCDLPLSDGFRGVWRQSSIFTGRKMLEYTRNGGGIVRTGLPKSFPYDGRDYPTGPGTTEAWRIVSRGVYEGVFKLNGCAIRRVTLAVSDDGQEFTDTALQVTSGERRVSVWKRIGTAADREPIIGSWKEVSPAADAERYVSIQSLPRGVEVSMGRSGEPGLTLAGSFDGKPQSVNIGEGTWSVAMHQLGVRSFMATLWAGKLAAARFRYELSRDGVLTEYGRNMGDLLRVAVYRP